MPTTRRTSPRGNPNDAINQLVADHQRVRQLVQQYEKLAESDSADDERKQQLAQRICQEIDLHARLEEELFYPTVRASLDLDDLLDEAEVEHLSAKDLSRQIQSMSPDDHGYDARVTVLGEYVEHHVKEEESEMFPKVRRAKLDLAELGERMMQRRSQLQSEMSMQPFETIASMLTLPIRAAAAAARAGAAAGRRGAAAARGAAAGSPRASKGTRASTGSGTRSAAKSGAASKAGAASKGGSASKPRAGSKAATSRAAGAKASRGGATGARAAAGEDGRKTSPARGGRKAAPAADGRSTRSRTTRAQAPKVR